MLCVWYVFTVVLLFGVFCVFPVWFVLLMYCVFYFKLANSKVSCYYLIICNY